MSAARSWFNSLSSRRAAKAGSLESTVCRATYGIPTVTHHPPVTQATKGVI